MDQNQANVREREKKMERNTQGRFTQLPDAILHHILSLMPIKSAARTSVLSKKWMELWKCFRSYTTNLDFGEGFATSQTPQQYNHCVNQFLKLYKGKSIQTFHLFFHPEGPSVTHFENWVEFAVERRVRELDLDYYNPYRRFPLSIVLKKRFNSPHCIFDCDSLTILRLRSCNLSVPLNFSGFGSLKVLYLKWVEIADEMLEKMLLNCPVLDELTLWECYISYPMKISAPNLKLKRLTVFDCFSMEVEIFAPNLLSFHFNGNSDVYLFKNISSLEDAIVTAVNPNNFLNNCDQAMVLPQFTHVKILTISDMTLLDVYEEAYEGAPVGWPIIFPNLVELQLIIRVLDNPRLAALFALFKYFIFPRLEKFFIELQTSPNNIPMEHFEEPVEEPSECVFHHLKTIKMTSFSGGNIELRLVKFLLDKAVLLESLALVMRKKCMEDLLQSDSTSQTRSNEAPSGSLLEQLLLLPKASPDAQMVLCEQSEDDGSSGPTHTKVYDWINM